MRLFFTGITRRSVKVLSVRLAPGSVWGEESLVAFKDATNARKPISAANFLANPAISVKIVEEIHSN